MNAYSYCNDNENTIHWSPLFIHSFIHFPPQLILRSLSPSTNGWRKCTPWTYQHFCNSPYFMGPQEVTSLSTVTLVLNEVTAIDLTWQVANPGVMIAPGGSHVAHTCQYVYKNQTQMSWNNGKHMHRLCADNHPQELIKHPHFCQFGPRLMLTFSQIMPSQERWWVLILSLTDRPSHACLYVS